MAEEGEESIMIYSRSPKTNTITIYIYQIPIRNLGAALYKIIIYLCRLVRILTTKRTRSISRVLVVILSRLPLWFFFILHCIIMSFDKAATTAVISNHIRKHNVFVIVNNLTWIPTLNLILRYLINNETTMNAFL